MTTCARPAGAEAAPQRYRYRAIFISDLHLGSKGCKADHLLDFLCRVDSEYLYLVGDIVDGWRLQKRWFWPDAHGEILARLFGRAGDGTKVVYLPGNHDEALRRLIGGTLGAVQVVHEIIHETADGRRLLVIHGDLFDTVVREMRWLALLGSFAYDATLKLNTVLNAVRRRLGLRYWSLSGWLKDRVKTACRFIDDFEQTLAAEARRRQVCGVICGHVHKPEIRTIEGVLYVNDGDWVESCSALVEHQDGRLELLDWAGGRSVILPPVRTAVAATPGRQAAVAA